MPQAAGNIEERKLEEVTPVSTVLEVRLDDERKEEEAVGGRDPTAEKKEEEGKEGIADLPKSEKVDAALFVAGSGTGNVKKKTACKG